MNGENRRSKEAVRNSIRTYGVKVMDPAALPLKKTKETESQESVSRFSEKSLHSQYEMDEGSCTDCCKSCVNRIPYATLVGFVLCAVGLLVVGVAEERATSLTKDMINNVLMKDADFFSGIGLGVLMLTLLTAIVAVLILVIGFLTTGDTRDQVYRAWQARIGGRIACIILMIVAVILLLVWFIVLIGGCFGLCVFVASKLECDLHTESSEGRNCLHVSLISLLINERSSIEICESQNIKKFCKDFVEKVGASLAVMICGFALIVFGLVIFLICLSANYARIRSQSKIQELHELQKVGIVENKNRF